MEMEEKIIRIISDGRRLDIQLSEASGLSRSRVASLMEEGCCAAGEDVCRKAGTKVTEGREIVLRVPAPKEAVPQPENIPLDILYEDEDLAVVIKPRGMVVHPAAGHEDGTLVNALLGNLSELSGIGGELRPGIVHRLDKDTSGLMIVAKNDETQTALSRMLKEREIEKHYLALTEGVFREREGRVVAPIGRSKKDRKKMAVEPDGREAVTEWRVLAEGRNCTLLDVHILTGRTHQIRVHMRSIQHPVCGDPLYGYEKGTRVPCLMLHARSLRFRHPRTGEEKVFQAPVPEDFRKGMKTNGVDLAAILPYRAVILDFDRTLLHTDKQISEYTVRVLRDWQQSGARLFAATARPARAIMVYQDQIPFDAVTTLNGARTITRDMVLENPISRDSAECILRQLCSMRGMVVSVEAEKGIYANMKIPAWMPVVMKDLMLLPQREKIYKILASHPEIPAEQIRIDLPGDTYSSVADGKLIQVMSREATKWNGIRSMLDAYRIDAAQAVYFGDDNDDMEPVLRCGCGVAVANALDCVREAADYITGSNDEDGVATFLSQRI